MSADVRATAVSVFGALVDDLRRQPDGAAQLAELLPENLPHHAGRSSADMVRMRGYLLAAFADTGLPDAALPFLIESVETGVDAYEVAGAAIGLRGTATLPADVPAALLRAVDNIGGSDATMSFESIRPQLPYARPTTALTELFRTVGCFDASAMLLPQLERLSRERERFPKAVLAELRHVIDAGRARPGNSAAAGDRCCGGSMPRGRAGDPPPPGQELRHVELQDQDGRVELFEHYFRGRPAVVTFFYTRCDNPFKCSATITKLAAIQRSLRTQQADARVTLAAISYDPDFDIPERLRVYGADRGVVFDASTRFFRATSGFAELRRWFDLGVNYGGSTVNRHQIEVYLLDSDGGVATSFRRSQWHADTVLRAIADLLSDEATTESKQQARHSC